MWWTLLYSASALVPPLRGAPLQAVNAGQAVQHEFAGASGAEAYVRAKSCLEGTSFECNIEELEAAYRVLDQEVIRAECSEAQQQDIDELWRIIKMVYNGASITDALIARRASLFPAPEAYETALQCLDPTQECEVEEMASAYDELNEVRPTCSPAQLQVINQLERALSSSPQKAWAWRESEARSRLNINL